MARSNLPSLRFLVAHPAHFFALGCGSGLSSVAPGTVGTAFAWLSFLFLKPHFTDMQFLLFLAICYVAGIFFIQKTGTALGEIDHGSIVWDEIVPFWLVLLMTPEGWLWQSLAFFFFRAFDIGKPFPASYFDEEVKNGFGVMADDLVAAFYSLLCLALIQWVIQ